MNQGWAGCARPSLIHIIYVISRKMRVKYEKGQLGRKYMTKMNIMGHSFSKKNLAFAQETDFNALDDCLR